MRDIVVIGSINQDVTVLTPRLPHRGETVLGIRHYSGGGGKGANQAVAVARLGGDVAMVGRVGNDEFGRTLVESLRSDGVDISHVGVDDEAETGLAVITVDERAENTIVVSPGANMRLGPHHLNQELIASARVVIAQLEVPLGIVAEAAAIAKGTFVLNPAPAQQLPSDLLARVDVLVPNRSELGILAGKDEPITTTDIEKAARHLGHPSLVVTLGAEGALIVEEGRSERIPTPEVAAVDPTGAGDAFCGALAEALSRDVGLHEAVRRAVVAGALATTRPGAQAAMPTTAEIESIAS